MIRYDVAVVGAGHAGIEAALAAARLGLRTVCFTLNIQRAGHLPCNCSIGGPAKGHLAREVDALGGQMGVVADRAATHIRRVGTGKGPAVQTVRLHVCKALYPRLMQESLLRQPGLDLVEGEVLSLAYGDRIDGLRVRTAEGIQEVTADAVVLTTGTFLNGLCHIGDQQTVAARHGDQAVTQLPMDLLNLGVRLKRFKTGTTPRLDGSTIDWDATEPMPSEPEASPISFLHDQLPIERELFACHRTQTTQATHDLIRQNLKSSALFGGHIQGVGPRYCPSVEDKIVRFADKDSHPIFLERERWEGESIYVQGFSTSLPEEVQLAALRTVPGLADCRIIRPGYAVEYDMADPTQLHPSLMSKQLPGLFFAGQLNGTSGYEEAAAQGLVAGVNAARYSQKQASVIFPRETSFVGVMIDDLVTKGVEDPYRMLTARAEHRLLLRHDNADQRLTPLAREIGLCSEERWQRYDAKSAQIARDTQVLEASVMNRSHAEALAQCGMPLVEQQASLFQLLQRPGTSLESIERLATLVGLDLGLSRNRDVRAQVELAGKYQGYIQMQARTAAQTQKLGGLAIPEEFAFDSVRGLSYESIEKLTRVKPGTVGQASRIPGVRPPDIALLIGHLKASAR